MKTERTTYGNQKNKMTKQQQRDNTIRQEDRKTEAQANTFTTTLLHLLLRSRLQVLGQRKHPQTSAKSIPRPKFINF